jgi:hypothetical protein
MIHSETGKEKSDLPANPSYSMRPVGEPAERLQESESERQMIISSLPLERAASLPLASQPP